MQRFLRFILLFLFLFGRLEFANAQDNATLFAEADARIEQYRKENLRIKVLDSNGKPVNGAVVDVEQNSHEFLFGCNIFKWGRCRNEGENKTYNDRYAALFNFATLGYYWPSYERERGKPSHDFAKQVAEWCKANNIATKGHPLAWNHSDAGWFKEVDADELFQLQLARINDCVKTMSGLIDCWDVVNEVTHFDRGTQSALHTAMWKKVGKLEFTQACFVEARKAGPNATLLINDYRTDEEYVKVIEQLVDANGKRLYDVIGIQSHMHTKVWDNVQIWDTCERFARFGVPLHFTELTILSGQSGRESDMQGQPWITTPEGEERQKNDVLRVYTMLFSHPLVEAITWWDFSDQGAWQNAPAGFLRNDLSPKPVYDALLEQIKNRWTTKVQLKTDANGTATVRAFRGDYTIRIGDTVTPHTVKKGTEEELVVTLPVLAEEPKGVPPIKVVYFTPSDRTPPADRQERLGRVMKNIQEFYRKGLEANGHGSKTFALEWETSEKLRLYDVQGEKTFEEYPKGSEQIVHREVRNALKQKGINIDEEYVLILGAWVEWKDGIAREIGPYGGGGNMAAGCAFACDDPFIDADLLASKESGGFHYMVGHCSLGMYNTLYIGGIAHELGHAFGLPHEGERDSQRDTLGISLMGIGNHYYGKALRNEGHDAFLPAASALVLSEGRAFNPNFTREARRLDIDQLDASYEEGKLIVNLKVRAEPPLIGVIAYNDNLSVPGDYDAKAWLAAPDKPGEFRLEIDELEKAPYEMRLNFMVPSGRSGLSIRYSNVSGTPTVQEFADSIP